MHPNLLHVVVVRENPRRFHVPDENYLAFEDHMLSSGVNLTVVECVLGERPFALADRPHVHHVPVRSRTMLWHKENLVNIGVSRLPADWKYLAWIDADVAFRRKDWAAETVHGLQHYKILQPWDTCYDLGPGGSHMELHRSFGYLYTTGKPIVQGPRCGPNTGYQFAHPGYAWAMTRDAYVNVGGLIETAILGAADHHMALASIGRAEDTIPGNIGSPYAAPILRWQADALRHIHDRVGYVPGTIEHAFHGPKAARKYIDRWQILIDNKFDPATDLKRNEFGVFELSGAKPQLTRQIETYFSQRNEDQNTA